MPNCHGRCIWSIGRACYRLEYAKHFTNRLSCLPSSHTGHFSHHRNQYTWSFDKCIFPSRLCAKECAAKKVGNSQLHKKTSTLDHRRGLQYDSKLEEKKGGRVKLDNESKGFKEFIQNNWLIDLPFNNGLYTWNNKRSGSQQITSRLDIFLISNNSVNLGGKITASILPLSGSYHWPISLQWTRPGDAIRKPFIFETFWLTHPDFKNIVKLAWENFTPTEGSTTYQFQQRLKHLKKQIKHWNHTTFDNIFQG